eukprot:TRINITY_DN8262_c0_g1_i1.p1 TRINITY_DN8262_c0_g1~~TRINITY_DN8262_c0_g1_i1.p1  ORF type:complete len:539 (-),score=105.73 TRINITY_DN8262_c0_g1_i1:945-2561(-)
MSEPRNPAQGSNIGNPPHDEQKDPEISRSRSSEITALNQEIKALKTEVVELKTEVVDLKGDLDSLRGGIFRLQETVNSQERLFGSTTVAKNSSERLLIKGNSENNSLGSISNFSLTTSKHPSREGSTTAMESLPATPASAPLPTTVAGGTGSIEKMRRSSQAFEHMENFNSRKFSISSAYFSNSSEEDLSGRNVCRGRRRFSMEQDMKFGVSSAQSVRNASMEDAYRAIPFQSGLKHHLDHIQEDERDQTQKRRRLEVGQININSVENSESEAEAERNGTSQVIRSKVTAPLAPINYAFFAVYDGHGGPQAADFLRMHLHGNIVNHPKFREDPEEAIREGFRTTERQFTEACSSNRAAHGIGTTAVIALIATSNSATTLYVAHVGDSEAVLCRKKEAVVLTQPHNVKNPAEKARVEQVGGQICGDRLAHPVWNPAFISIAVTRAFGDLYFKLDEYTNGNRSGLIAEPEITKIQLTTDDDFLILASDGFWDVVSKESAVKFVASQPKDWDVDQICREMIGQALDEKTLDDTTVLLVKLR